MVRIVAQFKTGFVCYVSRVLHGNASSSVRWFTVRKNLSRKFDPIEADRLISHWHANQYLFPKVSYFWTVTVK